MLDNWFTTTSTPNIEQLQLNMITEIQYLSIKVLLINMQTDHFLCSNKYGGLGLFPVNIILEYFWNYDHKWGHEC